MPDRTRLVGEPDEHEVIQYADNVNKNAHHCCCTHFSDLVGYKQSSHSGESCNDRSSIHCRFQNLVHVSNGFGVQVLHALM
jgi:hypothetical protein